MSEGMEFESTVEGKTVQLKMLTENINIERKCDTEYHIAYTQLMKRGILPKASLEKLMIEEDIWSKKDETALGDLQTQLVELQIKLEAATTHEEGLMFAKAMGSLRADCLQLVEAKAAVLSNSCESLSDAIRRDAYIAYATVHKETSKNIFQNYKDFLLRANEQVVLDARSVLLTIATQAFQESLVSLPEVHYVQEVEKQLVKEEAELQKKAATTKKKATKKATKKKTVKKAAKKATT